MYDVGDKVIITKYTIPYHGVIEFVKGFAYDETFYVVMVNGKLEHVREDEIIKDE